MHDLHHYAHHCVLRLQHGHVELRHVRSSPSASGAILQVASLQ